MKKLKLVAVMLLLLSFSINAQEMFKNFSGEDIGAPKINGDYKYDKKVQKFRLEGSGYNIWFERDEFYFVSQKVKGDFILSANLNFLGEGVNAHRKIGLMIRNSNAEDAVYMDGAIHGDGLTALQYRIKKGAETLEKSSDVKAPGFVQVERKGDEFFLRVSKDGQPLHEVGKVTLKMDESVLTGMFISSHDENVKEKAQFWNVRLVKPAAEEVSGYQQPSPSRLEILDVETGLRRVVYETNEHIEAPNWSRNGKFLIYNCKGRLYRFNLKNGKREIINTNGVVNNNNDHGISFDGETLAISSGTEVDGKTKSIIYTVPIEGGIPKRVTPKGPSYWHGWSPDGVWLTYCAERGGNYDVYKIPSQGGREIRLTEAEGLDDGPEYSSDGKYIYFNSSRTGTMQIWRMKPDGSDEVQVTFDKYNDWFAHPSPDGKQFIMISYPEEIPATSHPHNKRVMLRTMPTTGGKVKTVAFLYGGQGTLNVPSWSPDSKKVAFVSYTY